MDLGGRNRLHLAFEPQQPALGRQVTRGCTRSQRLLFLNSST
jgi:hypothetical protein